jgi:hypothetical protein
MLRRVVVEFDDVSVPYLAENALGDASDGAVSPIQRPATESDRHQPQLLQGFP